MKTQPKILIISTLTLIFVLCFFQTDGFGLNVFAASLFFAFAGWMYAQNLQQKIVLIGLMVAGAGVFLNGFGWSFFTTIVAFFVAAIGLVLPQFEPFSAFFMGFLNLLLSPFLTIIEILKSLNKSNSTAPKRAIAVVIPLFLLLIFGGFYYQSSPTFRSLVGTLHWADFPEFAAITILGILISGTFILAFVPAFVQKLFVTLFIRKSKQIDQFVNSPNTSTGWLIGIWGLNLLLLVVVASDIFYRLKGELPQNLSHWQYLHQGIYSSIVSVVFAGVLSVLTGSYAQTQNRKKQLTANHIFIALNVVFVFLNVLRNHDYIFHYGLTEKRIVIYFYLALCFVGLMLTVYTILQKKSILSLYKLCTFSVAIALILSSLPNWSNIITRYNLTHIPKQENRIDYWYLIGLGPNNAHLLYPHLSQMTDNESEYFQRQGMYIYTNDSEDFRSFNLADYWANKSFTQQFATAK
ncbi:MAG: DUF4173 domain-containing protein [Flavobacteriales bacterium]|nr:DUF4173 domain-containing protein [Flavobacteriales bacterium]